MPIGSTFWAAAGDGCRWIHDTTAYRVSLFASRTIPYLGIRQWKGFQLPYSVGDTNNVTNVASLYDTGLFSLVNSATDPTGLTRTDPWPSGAVVCRATQVAHIGEGGSAAPQPQWKELGGSASLGVLKAHDAQPVKSATTAYKAIHQTGFIDALDGTPIDYTSTFGGPQDMLVWFPETGGQLAGATETRCWVWHYNPWAWFGTVPEVVADIAMKSGLPVSYIDTDAFDNAYDAYDLLTGDVPFCVAARLAWTPVWPGCSTKYEIGCSRKVGRSVINTILECAAHSRDMYFVNEAGKLSVSSFTRPPLFSGLSLADGVIDIVEWSWSVDGIFNTSIVTWGDAVKASGDPHVQPGEAVAAGELNYTAAWEPSLASYFGNKCIGTHSITDSVQKYGAISLRGDKRTSTVNGLSREIETYHMPMLFNPHSASGNLVPPVHGFGISDARPYRLVTVKQDMRALNWGIGDKVSNVRVTDDGQTILETRCIERTYDFDRLTVTSVLMELPAKT
jgi:hypothetical protein